MIKKNEKYIEFPIIENLEKIKKDAELVDIEETTNANTLIAQDLLNEFEKAKDRGSARLYLSLSNLVNCIAWIIAAIAVFLIIWWLLLEYQVTYDEKISEESLLRKQNLINKFEDIFSYIITTALGFAGGVCKMFLHRDK